MSQLFFYFCNLYHNVCNSKDKKQLNLRPLFSIIQQHIIYGYGSHSQKTDIKRKPKKQKQKKNLYIADVVHYDNTSSDIIL